MRVLIQRVTDAEVFIDEQSFSKIGKGLLIFIGIGENDNEEDIEYLTKKIIQLRIFEDENEKTNLSIENIDGELLAVSQFTLFAKTKKGNRPSFIDAAKPEISKILYEKFCDVLENLFNKEVKRGLFGAHMKISLCNDGPMTIWMDSKNR